MGVPIWIQISKRDNLHPVSPIRPEDLVRSLLKWNGYGDADRILILGKRQSVWRVAIEPNTAAIEVFVDTDSEKVFLNGERREAVFLGGLNVLPTNQVAKISWILKSIPEFAGKEIRIDDKCGEIWIAPIGYGIKEIGVVVDLEHGAIFGRVGNE